MTNGQYAALLNATAATDTHGLYNSRMSSDARGGITQSGTSGSFTYSLKSDFENKPVIRVSFWDAARFANWLTNGQPTGVQGNGTTEDGMYNLGGMTIPINNTITRDATAWNNGGVAIASENEWYKAAYYDGSGGYTLYPTQSDTAPTAANPPGGTNSANFSGVPNTVTDVGAYTGSASHYGTFDQGGNVSEWNDAIVDDIYRGLRGGSFFSDVDILQSSDRGFNGPIIESSSVGFRVASVPEPTSFLLTMLAGGVMLARRKR